jgi:hypothetical protein
MVNPSAWREKSARAITYTRSHPRMPFFMIQV